MEPWTHSRQARSEAVVRIEQEVGSDAHATSPQGSDRLGADRVVAQAVELVDGALAAGEIEGHLVALVLHSGYAGSGPGAPSFSRWDRAVERLQQRAPVDPRLRSAQAVAVAGLRAALGGSAHPDFAVAAKREVSRAELPPAVSVRDDERLLLGVAAGTGVMAPHLAPEVLRITEARRHNASVRQVCLDVWAEALLFRAPRLTPETANRGMSLVTSPYTGRPKIVDEDRIALYWLATRLLNAPWNPTDTHLSALEPVLADGQRAVQDILLDRRLNSALDAALVLDALAAAPASRLIRRSVLETVLTVIDAFTASATVLTQRYANRTAVEIHDEYDVQDLFRSLTLPFVPDLQPEDPAPKVAGKSSRLDFTSKAARLGFELKHVKGGASRDRIRSEILLDERTYQEHPYVDTVIVFIHDPNVIIALADRPSFEADLSQTVSIGGRTVRYIVRVR